MEIAEFVEETGKLEKFYDKELKPFEREIWYQQLKFLPISRYRQIVNKSFGECKFLPKLADILELHKQLPYRSENVQAKQNVKCDKCGGKGIFIYTKVLDNGANLIILAFFSSSVSSSGGRKRARRLSGGKRCKAPF